MANDVREQVKQAIERLGVGQTAKRLGLSVETVLRLAVGADVHPGTLTHARQNAPHLAA